jgi:hypothetical protein
MLWFVFRIRFRIILLLFFFGFALGAFSFFFAAVQHIPRQPTPIHDIERPLR